MRAIQLDPRNPFPSALEAWAELDRVLHYSDPIGEIAALKTFLTRYQARVAADSAKTAGPTAMPLMAARPAAPSVPSAMPASAAVASVTPQSAPQAVVHPRPVAVPSPTHDVPPSVSPAASCTPRHPHALTLPSLQRSRRQARTIRRPRQPVRGGRKHHGEEQHGDSRPMDRGGRRPRRVDVRWHACRRPHHDAGGGARGSRHAGGADQSRRRDGRHRRSAAGGAAQAAAQAGAARRRARDRRRRAIDPGDDHPGRTGVAVHRDPRATSRRSASCRFAPNPPARR